MKCTFEDSSMLSSAEYDPIQRELTITFKNNNARYKYHNIPEDIVLELFACEAAGESAGKYFSKTIKSGGYQYERLEDE